MFCPLVNINKHSIDHILYLLFQYMQNFKIIDYKYDIPPIAKEEIVCIYFCTIPIFYLSFKSGVPFCLWKLLVILVVILPNPNL